MRDVVLDLWASFQDGAIRRYLNTGHLCGRDAGGAELRGMPELGCAGGLLLEKALLRSSTVHSSGPVPTTVRIHSLQPAGIHSLLMNCGSRCGWRRLRRRHPQRNLQFKQGAVDSGRRPGVDSHCGRHRPRTVDSAGPQKGLL